ncbi:uncharacterized protein P175DRAFT_0556420 [Neofusicoccum parvum]|nr:uncharacterized protein P175DRAFT_0556420 [Neofusicoccum parvum]
MSAVAVAGGFGDLGRVFVTSLVAARKPVYILTRKAYDSAAEHGATPLEVDYSNVPVLAEVLAAHNIGTVISALNMDSQNASDAQISLIQAASASGSVTRFIPSDFNVDYDVSDE